MRRERLVAEQNVRLDVHARWKEIASADIPTLFGLWKEWMSVRSTALSRDEEPDPGFNISSPSTLADKILEPSCGLPDTLRLI
jgi:hypothetical protein